MSKITKRKYVEQEVMEFVLPSENQQIVKVVGGRGNNLHEVVDAQKNTFLVSMPCKFRKNIWIKRGDFVIIDPIEEGDKVKGEITHILFEEHVHHIQEEGLWPEAFGRREVKSTNYVEEDLLPPCDSDSEEEDLAKVVNANKGNRLYEEEDFEEEEEEEESSDEGCEQDMVEEDIKDCRQKGADADGSEEMSQS